jgi:hypothetical protein
LLVRSFVLLTFLLFAPALMACTCVTIGIEDEKARAYYRDLFKGAVFTGKITSIRELSPIDVRETITFPLRELTIDVEQYWLGVTDPVIKVVTTGANTSCTMEFPLGETRFFIADVWEGRLNFGMCSLSNWRGRFPDKGWSDYTQKILGAPKTFPKRN